MIDRRNQIACSNASRAWPREAATTIRLRLRRGQRTGYGGSC